MRAETSAWLIGHKMTNRRIDDLDRKVMGHIALIHRKMRNGNGHAGRAKSWATMALIALVSLLGLFKPELAVMLLQRMAH